MPRGPTSAAWFDTLSDEGFVEAAVGVSGRGGPERFVPFPPSVETGVGLRPVMSATRRVKVVCGGRPAGRGFVVVEVAPLGGDGAGREPAGPGPQSDGEAELAGRESAHPGHIEQMAPVVGEKSVVQGAWLGG